MNATMKDGDRNETQEVAIPVDAGDKSATKELPARSNDLVQVTSVPLMQVSLRKIAVGTRRAFKRARANPLAPLGLLAAEEGESRGGGGVGATAESFNPLSGRRLQSGGRHPPRRRRTIDRDRFPFPSLSPPQFPLPLHSERFLDTQILRSVNLFYFFFYTYYLYRLYPSHVLLSHVLHRLCNPNIINYTVTLNCAFVFTRVCMPAR